MATVSSVLGITIGAQFMLGGIVRIFSWPFTQSHNQVQIDYAPAAEKLYPLIPFRNVVEHNRYVGAWFLVTGSLLAYRRTRKNVSTLGLTLFWTGVLAYGQNAAGLSFWWPVCNAVLVSGMWWLERQTARAERRD